MARPLKRGGNSGWSRVALSKVPEVAIGFWIIKIAATTLGETAGDALSMGLGLGYLTSTIIFFGLFLVLVVAQIRAERFHPYLYWGVVVGRRSLEQRWRTLRTAHWGLGIRAERRSYLGW
jgi:uncharacterized membrane-anchored protein